MKKLPLLDKYLRAHPYTHPWMAALATPSLLIFCAVCLIVVLPIVLVVLGAVLLVLAIPSPVMAYFQCKRHKRDMENKARPFHRMHKDENGNWTYDEAPTCSCKSCSREDDDDDCSSYGSNN